MRCNDDLLFQDQETAHNIAEVYEGADPNLYELINNYPEMRSLAERLAYGDEYKGILEKFSGNSKPVTLEKSEIERITKTIEERKKVFRKTLNL